MPKSLPSVPPLRATIVVAGMLWAGCANAPDVAEESRTDALSRVSEEVEAAVQLFHRADTAMDAEAVIGLLWPDYTMLVDGVRVSYEDVARGSREFMASLDLFHTEWTDLQIRPLGPDAAIASFQFRDSIVTAAGDIIRSRGPTILVWQRREGQWRLVFGDADHYPIDP